MILPQNILLLAGILVLGTLGLILAIWGWTRTKDTRRFLAASKTAVATIVEIRADNPRRAMAYNNTDRSVAYFAVLEFHACGTIHRFLSGLAINPNEHPVGDRIDILYDRNRPDDARQNRFSAVWGSDIFLIIFGAAFLAAAALLYLFLYLGYPLPERIGIPAFLGIFCLLSLRGTWSFTGESLYLANRGTRVTGALVNGEDATAVEYRVGGRTYRHQVRLSSDAPVAESGAPMEVLYDPERPGRARANTFTDLWFIPILLGSVTAGILLITAVAVFFLWKA